MNEPSTTVRPVEAADFDRIAKLVSEGFPRLKPGALKGIWDYHWEGAQQKPNLGFALWSGDEIVGYLGAVYGTRTIGSRTARVCNLSTWYVKPAHRTGAIRLLYAAIAQKDWTLTSLTASAEVSRVLKAMGFRPMDQRKRLYLPWQFPGAMLRRSPAISSDPGDVERTLQGVDRVIHRDHLPYGLKHYVLRSPGDYSYLILKRRVFPGTAAFGWCPIRKVQLLWYPCMEVLYLSNPDFACAHWPDVAAHIFRSERVLGLVTPERFLPKSAPPAPLLDNGSYVMPRTGDPQIVDALYSELVVLAI